MDKLTRAAWRAVTGALKIKKGEQVLLVTDRQKMPIAEALAHWCGKAGAETTTYLMTETLRPITGPTKLFTLMIDKAGVTLYLLDARIEEKPFRGYMVQTAGRHGRICMMPGITVDMMERLVNVDFKNLDVLGKKVIARLRDAVDVHVTNPLGTDIRFSVAGRKCLLDNGDISQKGKHGNLPAGEVYTTPVEKGFTGRVVLSLIDDRVGRGVMDFRDGVLTHASGKGVEAILKNIGSDKTGRIIGEFGIGTNKGAKICKNMLEAEKAFGTVHFAIGDSYGVGKNRSKHHYDALVEKATLVADGKEILKNGKFCV
jgi:leucyl aminopeptidase (aminopeptidase T)